MRKRTMMIALGVLLLLSVEIGMLAYVASTRSTAVPARAIAEKNWDYCEDGNGYVDYGDGNGGGFAEEGPFEHPTLSGSEETLDTEHFRLHYTLSGKDAVPGKDGDGNGLTDYVEDVAGALEHVYEVEINRLDWTAPPPDGEWGGNSLYDVYLLELLSEGAAGFTDGGMPETIVGDNPNSPGVEETRASISVMALDNDYAEVEEEGDNPMDVMRVTAAHEFFHAIQFGYDGLEPAEWIWEATATWMQDEVYDDINADNATIAFVVESPSNCQTEADPYGMWVFFRHISERYGHETVRNIWEQARTKDGYHAIEAALSQAGASLDDTMNGFALTLLARNFEEGADYPPVRLEGSAAGEAFTPHEGIGQMGMDFVELEVSGVNTISLDNPDLTGMLVAVADGQAGVFDMAGGEACIDASRFDHLYLVIVNHRLAEAPGACEEINYTVDITPGGSADEVALVFDIPNFIPPEIGEEAGGAYEGWEIF